MRQSRADVGCGGCSERPTLGNSSLRHTARGRRVAGTRTALTAHERSPTISLCRCPLENQAVPDGLRAQCEDLQELILLNQKISSERSTPRCSTALAAAWPPLRENGCFLCFPQAICTNTFASNVALRRGPKRNRSGRGYSGHKPGFELRVLSFGIEVRFKF